MPLDTKLLFMDGTPNPVTTDIDAYRMKGSIDGGNFMLKCKN